MFVTEEHEAEDENGTEAPAWKGAEMREPLPPVGDETKPIWSGCFSTDDFIFLLLDGREYVYSAAALV